MLVRVSRDHFLQHAGGHKRDIRWTLGETAHEIRIPLRSERHVHAHTVSLAHELVLQIAADTVEHLKLEAIGLDVILDRKTLRLANHSFVVSRDARIMTLEQ